MRHARSAAIRNALLALTAAAAGSARASTLPAANLATAGAALVASIGPRPAGAPTGSEILARLSTASSGERRRELVKEVLRGNVPGFLRQLKPVPVSLPAGTEGGAGQSAVMWVMPDYLAVGSDDDFVRVPLGLDEAVEVARAFGFTLPTPKMVDAIYQHADKKLAPQPLPAGPAMTSVDYLRRHEQSIAAQLRGSPRDLLVSGDKKDVVLSARLATHPGKVAIYGWHDVDGRAIQPLSTVHVAGYADYSHGVRLVSDTLLVDGQPRFVFDVLEDARLAGFLSDEGAMPQARHLLAPAARTGARARLLAWSAPSRPAGHRRRPSLPSEDDDGGGRLLAMATAAGPADARSTFVAPDVPRAGARLVVE